MAVNDSISIKDNSKEVLEAFQKQLALGLEAIGLKAEGYAKQDCPVDVGRLRNSITYATQKSHGKGESPAEPQDYATIGTPEENEIYIGTNVEYAVYVEMDDTKDHSKESGHSGKAHFLRDACATHTDEYKKLLEDALKS